jgi:hypothetical protein
MGTPVSTPDIQYFGSDGTWIKPSRAARVDVIVQGGQAGTSTLAGSAPAWNGNAGYWRH